LAATAIDFFIAGLDVNFSPFLNALTALLATLATALPAFTISYLFSQTRQTASATFFAC
jgi:hypothetical protein